MKTSKKILISIATFICTISISTFIWLLGIQTTILNREVVKEWISSSNFYSSFVKDISQNIIPESGDALTSDIIATSLDNTFPPEYVKSQSENVIDSFYDWMEGKTSHFIFTINLQDKNDTLTSELSKSLQPKIASLPACPNDQLVTKTIDCKPANLSTEQISEEVSKQFTSNIEIFNQPFISESIVDIDNQQINQIPMYRSWIDALVILLPLISILSITIILLASPDKLLEISRLSRQIFVGSITTLAISLIIVYSVNNIYTPPNISGESNVLVVTFSSVFQKIIGGIATQIAIISGIFTGLSATSWIIFKIINKKNRKDQLLKNPVNNQSQHIETTNDSNNLTPSQ